ncbi:MAG TPA: cytochrome c biogenesis protein CcdA [Bellilinea sp.]|nr:cytochrome c biogenesis protein CcdA [Bellilinea sp.]
MQSVSIWLAFLAGLASFLSPCVFSLVPAYIGYLGGRSAAYVQTSSKGEKLNTFLNGLAFVLGFTVVFLTLGLTMSVIGGLLYDLKFWLAKIGGVLIVILGLHMIGLFRIPFLESELHPKSDLTRKRGFLSSFLLGITFSAGWSPCIGPILGMILTLAINQGSPVQGIWLLAFYSMGLAIPFLLASLGIGWVTGILRRHAKLLRGIEIAMGVILVIVGVLLFFGLFNQLGQFGTFVDFGL